MADIGTNKTPHPNAMQQTTPNLASHVQPIMQQHSPLHGTHPQQQQPIQHHHQHQQNATIHNGYQARSQSQPHNGYNPSGCYGGSTPNTTYRPPNQNGYHTPRSQNDMAGCPIDPPPYQPCHGMANPVPSCQSPCHSYVPSSCASMMNGGNMNHQSMQGVNQCSAYQSPVPQNYCPPPPIECRASHCASPAQQPMTSPAAATPAPPWQHNAAGMARSFPHPHAHQHSHNHSHHHHLHNHHHPHPQQIPNCRCSPWPQQQQSQPQHILSPPPPYNQQQGPNMNPHSHGVTPQHQQCYREIQCGDISQSSPMPAGMRHDTYQRTLEYVQQCSQWAGGEIVSSSTHPNRQAQQEAMTASLISQPSSNMVINDMSSTLKSLQHENRYLQLIQ